MGMIINTGDLRSSCRAMLISQKSGEGGGDNSDWTMPAHWLDIPDPKENQVVMYCELPEDTNGYSIPIHICNTGNNVNVSEIETLAAGGTINWGDGNITTIKKEEAIVPYGGSKRIATYGHKYTGGGQYIITVTIDADEPYIYFSCLRRIFDFVDGVSSDILNDDIDFSTLRAIKFGSNVKILSYVNGNSEWLFYPNTYGDGYYAYGIVYIKFFGEVPYVYFNNLHTLQKVEFVIPPMKIEISAFAHCESLVDFSFIENLTDIPNNAFNGCYKLKSIKSSKITSIGRQAFQGCDRLEQIYLPNVTSLGNSAFTNCFSVKSVSFPNVVNCSYPVFYGLYKLEEVNMPQCIEIATGEFSNCYNLRKLILADGCNYNNCKFKNCFYLYPKPKN